MHANDSNNQEAKDSSSEETHVSKLCFSENMSKVPNFYKLCWPLAANETEDKIPNMEHFLPFNNTYENAVKIFLMFDQPLQPLVISSYFRQM